MFDLDSWFMPQNRSDRQKEVQAIELPYKCGKIEAELIAYRFLELDRFNHYMIIQPLPVGIL